MKSVLHWGFADSGLQRTPLCGVSLAKPGKRLKLAYSYQMRRALESDVDTCHACRAVFKSKEGWFRHQETVAGKISGLMAQEGLLDF